MILAGVFVGGEGRRMGGVAKGLLRLDGTTLVERWVEVLGELGHPAVLVGSSGAYDGLGVQRIADEPEGCGPLGGLVALLRRAAGRPVLALACDMPFVSARLVARLAAEQPDAPILAPRRGTLWEPLCARYDAAVVLPAAVARVGGGERSLQRLLDDVGAAELPTTPAERTELRDWDTPEDVAADQ